MAKASKYCTSHIYSRLWHPMA